MNLDVRDLGFWSAEARRIHLTRKHEQMEISLLPNYKSADIRRAQDRVRNELLDLNLGSQIEDVENITKKQRKYYEHVKRKRREGKK